MFFSIQKYGPVHFWVFFDALNVESTRVTEFGCEWSVSFGRYETIMGKVFHTLTLNRKTGDCSSRWVTAKAFDSDQSVDPLWMMPKQCS